MLPSSRMQSPTNQERYRSLYQFTSCKVPCMRRYSAGSPACQRVTVGACPSGGILQAHGVVFVVMVSCKKMAQAFSFYEAISVHKY